MISLAVRSAIGTFSLDIRLDLPEAGITALFGRSGAGKTSLLDIIAGLRRPDCGHIAVHGRVLYDSDAGIDVPAERRRVGYIFQDGRLFPHLSVRANLVYGMKRTPPGERQVGFDQVVGLLGIAGLLERRPRGLSGGEKQRVAIGRALLTSPRLLLLDEPLAALDPGRKAEVLPFIERLHTELGVPMVYVSHALDEVLAIADTMALIDDGRVRAVGPVEQIASSLELVADTGFAEAGTVIATTVARHDEGHGVTELDSPAGVLRVGRLDAAVGARIRLRVRARDVALALQPPRDISVLNILPGTVARIAARDSGAVEVAVEVAPGLLLWSEITRLAAARLALAPGTPVHALVKSVALERYPRR